MFSLIIPAYNEEKRIVPVIQNFLRKFSDIEIIVVSNGSTDNTVDVVKNLRNKRVKLLEFKQKLGKGGAIIQGLKQAKGSFVGFGDADQAVMPDDFKRLIKYLEDYDCAIGSRRAKGANISVKQSFLRVFSSNIFHIIVEIMFNLRIKDTQCGAKVLRKDAMESVLYRLTDKGYTFDIDLLYNLRKKRLRVKEIPVNWKHQEDSKFSLTNAPKMFLSLLRIRFK